MQARYAKSGHNSALNETKILRRAVTPTYSVNFTDWSTVVVQLAVGVAIKGLGTSVRTSV